MADNAIETVYASTGTYAWGTYIFDNRTSNVVIDGTNCSARIYNYASNVTINGGSGEIWNYGEDDGTGTNVIINVSSGSNQISNYCSYSTINCSSPDKTTIGNRGANVSISAGEGANTIDNSGDTVTIEAGAGNDYIINYGSIVTISTGDGNNTVSNRHNDANVLISCGSGNDIVMNQSASITIDGGGGNDKIYNGVYSTSAGVRYLNADAYEGGFSNVVFKYGANSGNHTIWGFRENSTLKVGGVELSDISSVQSANGQDIVVTIGNAQVSLVGLGPSGVTPVTNLNISTVETVSCSFGVVRTVIKALSFNVKRQVAHSIKLFKTNSEDIFHEDTSEPVTISADVVPDVSDNTDGIQSFSIQLAEQQLTDQVTFTGILDFNIMDCIKGQYFDYKYIMCVESVTQSGKLFSCRCCSSVDEILFTLLNYGESSVPEEYQVWHDVNSTTNATTSTTNMKNDELPYADEHFWQIANALDLEPIYRVENFHSTVDMTVAGVTYRDLIRSIFGWSARIPPAMINVFIRGNQLWAIQRGLEEHVIDISNAKITQPVFTRELVRTSWGETTYIETEVRTVATYKTTPIYEGIDKIVTPLKSDTRQDKDGTTTINYSYDDDGMLIKTEEISPTSRTVTTHTYITGASGNKFLSKEETTVYDLDGEQIDYRSVKHSPTNYGQAAVTAGNAQSENIVSTVKNVPYDERPTPYAFGQQLKALITEQTGSKRQERLTPGIVPFDTSFPVDEDYCCTITAMIRALNRATQETVTLSLYDFPHVIDFNDRILLNGNEYFLKSNKISTTPRVFHQQNLTLVRWFGF